jgi:CHRD domain
MKFVLPMIAVALAAVAAPVQAATFFATTLSGAKETIPNTSTATGFGNLTLSDDMNSVTLFLSWTGLNGGPATGAHIHCCALPGANGPVAIDFGPPAVVTGSLARTYDLTLLSTYAGGFLSANGGTAVSARAALLAGLTSGRTYFNVHNVQFPGGEIRGQLVAVPEVATWGMMIVGFGLVGGALRVRRRVAATA